MHFLNRLGVRIKINLGVLKFQLSNDKDVSAGTGKNIAEFIIRRLKFFKLVPENLVGLNVSKYVSWP